MKISKWVDMGSEVEIEIGIDDIRSALAESFSCVVADRLGEPGPHLHEVIRALVDISNFLRAMTDEQIRLLNPSQRDIVHKFLLEESGRFA